MPDFTSPFPGNVPRRMSKEELIRAIRLDLAAEQDATSLYQAHADATDDPTVQKVLKDIAEEEKVHAGEFMRLLEILTGDEREFMEEGAGEVNSLIGAGPGRRIEEPILQGVKVVPDSLRWVTILKERDDPHGFQFRAQRKNPARKIDLEIFVQGWESDGVFWVSIIEKQDIIPGRLNSRVRGILENAGFSAKSVGHRTTLYEATTSGQFPQNTENVIKIETGIRDTIAALDRY